MTIASQLIKLQPQLVKIFAFNVFVYTVSTASRKNELSGSVPLGNKSQTSFTFSLQL
jgi:hypothetical protein